MRDAALWAEISAVIDPAALADRAAVRALADRVKWGDALTLRTLEETRRCAYLASARDTPIEVPVPVAFCASRLPDLVPDRADALGRYLSPLLEVSEDVNTSLARYSEARAAYQLAFDAAPPDDIWHVAAPARIQLWMATRAPDAGRSRHMRRHMIGLAIGAVIFALAVLVFVPDTAPPGVTWGFVTAALAAAVLFLVWAAAWRENPDRDQDRMEQWAAFSIHIRERFEAWSDAVGDGDGDGDGGGDGGGD